MTDRSIEKTVAFVQKELQGAEGGHDWFHIERVWKNARHIAEKEGGDLLVVELAALLHDIADSKFHGGDETVGPAKAHAWMQSLSLPDATIAHVVSIIENISFKGGTTARTFHSKELDIVQDADRLDALGAIGIARTFNYGGFKNRSLYDPSVPPKLGMSKEEYKNSAAPTLNHFYEKLFLLKGLMNTETGKALAEERHQYMEAFVARFLAEWNGKFS
ncbi:MULTISPECIES: HD domain-containing protein [unclassified Flavobacterium]|uniref:HD domain-containing protein n=1 Tax=unclassified Flavobacterium TaxID=196869 RepID=UPI001F129F0B|nr:MULTISPECIES: HD domain-containing protein [unclassified Flavobacterium]UMY66334.1 HD domain-containing protein [Flavobacterium sp. HJ-32-4]